MFAFLGSLGCDVIIFIGIGWLEPVRNIQNTLMQVSFNKSQFAFKNSKQKQLKANRRKKRVKQVQPETFSRSYKIVGKTTTKPRHFG